MVGYKTKRLVVESLNDIETSNFKALLTYHFLINSYALQERVLESPHPLKLKAQLENVTMMNTSMYTQILLQSTPVSADS